MKAYPVNLSKREVMLRLEGTVPVRVDTAEPCKLHVGRSEFHFKDDTYYGSRIAWPPILQELGVRGVLDIDLTKCEIRDQ